jgi:hypothetical protein
MPFQNSGNSHGNHNVLWEHKEKLKETYHYSDRIVLSTFGLISENKNIETTLFALPEIVKKHPSLINNWKNTSRSYQNEGEKYRKLATH